MPREARHPLTTEKDLWFRRIQDLQRRALAGKAAEAAVRGKSLPAVSPTGGGKSVTFQLTAIIAGEAVHGLTVVISPLRSLMGYSPSSAAVRFTLWWKPKDDEKVMAIVLPEIKFTKG